MYMYLCIVSCTVYMYNVGICYNIEAFCSIYMYMYNMYSSQ